MKILITGVCGFVGSTLAKAIKETHPDWKIFGIDNLSRAGSETNQIPLSNIGVKLSRGDIRFPADLKKIAPVDWVVEAAANPSVLAGINGYGNSRELVDHNLVGTVNVLEFCKSCRAGFILLSTSRVYSIKRLLEIKIRAIRKAFRPLSNRSMVGLGAGGVRENFPTTPPISLYGATKLASESLALEYGEAFSFPVWINRCGVMAGAGQFGRADQGIISYWINSWLRKRELRYIGFGGNGHQVRDCLHPRDLLPLLDKQMASTKENRIRVQNVSGGNGSAWSLAQLSDWCANRFGKHLVASDPVNRQFDVPWLVLDSTLAKKQWDWRNQIPTTEIFEEIARHAEKNPHWLEISSREHD
jgi:CDP-paratose 2-epimerase